MNRRGFVAYIYAFAALLVAGAVMLFALKTTGVIGSSKTTEGLAVPTIVKENPDELNETNIIRAINEKRTSLGLPTLSVNQKLTTAANAFADDIFAQDYWDTKNPKGKTSAKFISEAGYLASSTGTDMARDFSGTASVVEAWTNSPTDKANISNKTMDDIGVAVRKGTLQGRDTTVIIQMLASEQKYVAPKAVAPVATSAPTRNKVLVNIDDSGGITKGSFYCYDDKVNYLADLQNQIRIKQIAMDNCDALARIESTNCSHTNCDSSAPWDTLNACIQKCTDDAWGKCNSDLGDLRKKLYAEVHTDCP